MKRWFSRGLSLLLVLFLLLEGPVAVLAAADVQVYVKESSVGKYSPYTLGKFEPAFGALLGATFDQDQKLGGNIAQAAAVYGKPYAAGLLYVSWNSPLLGYQIDKVKASNCALQLSMEPNSGLSAVNDGNYLRGIARELRDFGLPVFFRFGGEMNGEWTAWGMQPELYKEKFRLVAGVMRQEAPNVAMVWSPNYVPDKDIDKYYPGDAWVDWVGINGYADYFFVGNPANDSQAWTWTKFYQGHKANPLTKFKKIYDTYSAKKPIMISETGVAWANRNPYKMVDYWAAPTLKKVYGYIPLLYPRIKAVYYFNTIYPDDFSTYAVYGNQAMTQAFREAIASPYYLSSVNGRAPFSYRPLGKWASGKSCELAAVVDAGESNIVAVDYVINGKWIGRATQAPWNFAVNFPASGAATVEARAIAAGGAVVAKRAVKITVP